LIPVLSRTAYTWKYEAINKLREHNLLGLNEPRKCSRNGDMTGAYLEDRGEKVLRERVLEPSALGLAYRCPVGAAGNMAKNNTIIISISSI
jgi:hypothetical protein